MADEQKPSLASRMSSAINPDEFYNRAFEMYADKGYSADDAARYAEQHQQAIQNKLDRSPVAIALEKARQYYQDPAQIATDVLKGASMFAPLGRAGLAAWDTATSATPANAGEQQILDQRMNERIRQSQGYADGGAVDDFPLQRAWQEYRRQFAPGGVVDDQQNVDQPAMESTMPQEDMQPEAVMQRYAGTGLQFPQEAAMKRLAAKIKREAKAGAGDPKNERTVIKAPHEGLPDFVTGKIRPEDWVARHEKILNDDEIHKASRWYKEIKDEFGKYYEDPEELSKNMRAWLVAQQNVSPEGAMKNVLLQREQMARGVPKDLWKAGGMPNPTEAARSVLQGQEIGGGVGQKIADFVDSAEGKPVRSWMANHPQGGKPFVVDVHTARDTGMVDQELINHLSRLGYDKDALSKLQIDLTGTPTEAAYENRSRFGHELTDHLNKIGWKGRNDWSPEEIQAVGWMGMTKLTRDTEPTAESGLGRNYRRISYEIDPGEGSPWASKYGEAMGGLSPEEKADVTARIAHAAMDHASKIAGVDVHDLVHGTGAWEQYQNPAAVAQGLIHPTGGDIAANVLGYLLNQTEVWHNVVKPMTSSPKAFGVDFVETGTKNLENPEYLKDFWQKVMDADDTGLFRGFQPIRTPDGKVGIRALIDKGGVKTQNALEKAISQGGSIHSMLQSMGPDFEVRGHEAEISKHRNDWKEQPNGEGYLARLEQLLGSNPKSKLDQLRSELEKDLEGHLARVKKARGEGQGSPEVMARGGRAFGMHPVHKIPGIHIVTADAGEPIFTGEK